MKKKYSGVIYMRKLIAPGTEHGKVYIGQSTSIEERNLNWNKANNTNYGGKKITQARNKYGVGDSAWETKILETLYSDSSDDLQKQLDERETYNIRSYGSVENGFNSSYGNGMKGITHTESARAKISAHHRKSQSEETKAKISESNKNHVVSDETRAKISEGNKGKKRTEAMKAAQSARMKGKEPKGASDGLRKYVNKYGHGPTLGIKQTPQARANMRQPNRSEGQESGQYVPTVIQRIMLRCLTLQKH